MKHFYFLIIFFILVSSCSNSRTKEQECKNSKPSQINSVQKTKPIINVYIENSGSMDGYVKGKTEFKGAIRDLLVLLKYHYEEDSINLYFINQQIFSPESSTKIDLASFATDIEMKWRTKQAKKHWQSTNLNQIFKMILSKTDNNTISILFSDCIYSIHGSADATGLLNDEKSLTKDAFLSKWKNEQIPLATTVVKMNSKFKGKYFPYTGDNKNFFYEGIRPYYICVIANNSLLRDFNKNIEIKKGKIEGFDNKYILSSGDSNSVYFSVLQSSFNKGRFKPDRNVSTINYIHGIEDINLNNRGSGCSSGKEDLLSFAVAVNFTEIQSEEEYIINPKNYSVISNNFTIDTIFPIDKKSIHPSDWNRIVNSKPTHIIILTAKTKSVSDVTFVLKKQIPQWIENSNTENDTDKNNLNSKTFGLMYWIRGITEAYEIIYPNNNNFFEFTITINK